jgi:branched-chain amino acid transport system ATP-binding protein
MLPERSILRVERLSVRYEKAEALHGISLEVAAGQIVAVIGPNGAGKSSMLNAMLGALPTGGSSSGSISFEGHTVTGLPTERRVALGMCLVPERRELFGSMSVEDNLVLGAFRRKRAGEKDFKSQLPFVYELFPRLAERRSQRSETLSGGEQQMLAVGRALMAKPQLLLLDEPSLGLAPLVTREIFLVLSRLRGEGVTTLLVEQNARAALQIADRGYVLETGSVALEGEASVLLSNPRVKELYLGLGRKKANVEPRDMA